MVKKKEEKIFKTETIESYLLRGGTVTRYPMGYTRISPDMIDNNSRGEKKRPSRPWLKKG